MVRFDVHNAFDNGQNKWRIIDAVAAKFLWFGFSDSQLSEAGSVKMDWSDNQGKKCSRFIFV